MKKQFYLLGLFLLLSTGLSQAQEQYTTFKMVFKESGHYLSNENGALSVLPKKTNANSLSQLFILKRVGRGQILVASAAQPELFLKKIENQVILSPYNGDNGEDFRWEVNYEQGDEGYLVSGDSQLTLYPYQGKVFHIDLSLLNEMNGHLFQFEEVGHTF